MSYNHYPQPDSYPLDWPPEGYGTGSLRYSGDRVRISANPLPTRIILGSLETDPESLAMSKRLLLQATPTEAGMEWALADPQRPGVRIELQQGEEYPVGRMNSDLFPGDERNTRRYVSREQLTIFALGNEVEITQQGDTNNSYVMAPEGSFHVIPASRDAS